MGTDTTDLSRSGCAVTRVFKKKEITSLHNAVSQKLQLVVLSTRSGRITLTVDFASSLRKFYAAANSLFPH